MMWHSMLPGTPVLLIVSLVMFGLDAALDAADANQAASKWPVLSTVLYPIGDEARLLLQHLEARTPIIHRNARLAL